MTQVSSKWHERFLQLAQHVAGWSKDPSTQVGAVIAEGKHVVSLGFNGFPPSVPDHLEWLHNREEKLQAIVHAEVNAIINASRPVSGCVIYTWPFQPCLECTKICLAAKVQAIVTRSPTQAQLERWGASFAAAQQLLQRANIPLFYVDNEI